MQLGVQIEKSNPWKPAETGAPGATRTPDLQIRSLVKPNVFYSYESGFIPCAIVPLFSLTYGVKPAEYLDPISVRGTVNYAHTGLLRMLSEYEREHGRKPQVIGLGKTHLVDLQDYLESRPDGLYFEGVDVILHNDPIGVVFGHDNRANKSEG